MCMDETMALIESAHAGDKEARDRLVTDNMGLVWSIVKRFAGRGHEPEDLFQIGSIGLIKAIDKFDLSYDVRFSTYAVPLIVGEIKRFIRDDGMLKVSRSLKELAMKARAAREEMSGELAAALDSGAEVESLYKTIYRGDGNEICLIDKLEEEHNGQEQAMNRLVLAELLGELEPQERQIIIMRYYEERTQTQIAGILGISQVQVSRLEKKILKSMRDKLHGT